MSEGLRNIMADMKDIKQRQEALEVCANSFAQNGCQAVVITADNARVLDTLVLLSPEMSRQDHEAISKHVSEIIDIMRNAHYGSSQFGNSHADETINAGVPTGLEAHYSDDQPSTSSGEVQAVGHKRKQRAEGNDLLNKLAKGQFVVQQVEIQTPTCYDQLLLPEGKQQFLVETAAESIDDGYRWRKYGRKQVAGSPYLRHYFKCTTASCHVRKHVERFTYDPKKIVVTYEKLPHSHEPLCSRQHQVLKRLLANGGAVVFGNSQTPVITTGNSVNSNVVKAAPAQLPDQSPPRLPSATWHTYDPAPAYDTTATAAEPPAPPKQYTKEYSKEDRSLGGSGSAFKQWKVHGIRSERKSSHHAAQTQQKVDSQSSDSMAEADPEATSEDTKDDNEDLDLESTGTDVHLFQECVNAIQEHAKWNSTLHA